VVDDSLGSPSDLTLIEEPTDVDVDEEMTYAHRYVPDEFLDGVVDAVLRSQGSLEAVEKRILEVPDRWRPDITMFLEACFDLT
jgi:hypothetical protein